MKKNKRSFIARKDVRKNLLYILWIMGDVDPQLIGPFPTEAERKRELREMRLADPEGRNGIYGLDLDVWDGVPEVTVFSWPPGRRGRVG